MRHDPDFFSCTGPDCHSGQIHDAGPDGNNIFNCEECGFQSCVTHNAPMHHGQTCEEYEEMQRLGRMPHAEAEEATTEYLSKTTVKCPGKDCGYNIQKITGCDHMTCKYNFTMFVCPANT